MSHEKESLKRKIELYVFRVENAGDFTIKESESEEEKSNVINETIETIQNNYSQLIDKLKKITLTEELDRFRKPLWDFFFEIKVIRFKKKRQLFFIKEAISSIEEIKNLELEEEEKEKQKQKIIQINKQKTFLEKLESILIAEEKKSRRKHYSRM